MFFIRAGFWLALVIALIPVNPADLEPGQRSISTLETVGLAKSVANDITGFCIRNEETCATGSVLISQMGAKAREGARLAYTWLDERYGKENQPADSIDNVATGSLAN
jgi:hypothetical protein